MNHSPPKRFLQKFENFHLLLLIGGHLSPRRRYQVGILLILVLVCAFAEAVSLGAVLPFLGVLAAPEQVLSYPLMGSFARYLGMESARDLVVPITAVFLVVTLVASALRMLLLWSTTRLSYVISADLGLEAYRRTLYQPFRVHASRNTSEVIHNVAYNTGAAAGVFQGFLMLLSGSSMILAVMTTLFIINFKIALAVSLIFGIGYGTVVAVMRLRLKKNSELIEVESGQLVKVVQEGLGAIRDVLLGGTQPLYCEIYGRASRPLRLTQGNNVFLSGSPRFIMEAMGLSLIALLACYLSRQPGGVMVSLPFLGALALGAQRLLPCLQQVFSAWSTIAGTQAQMEGVLQSLEQPVPPELTASVPTPLPFKQGIELKRVCFRYAGDLPWVLQELSISIPRGSRVGIVGSTGSGKSSLLDLIMGLVEPDSGEVLVDGTVLGKGQMRAWQQAIAHVPQSIYLADASIAENIAFGVAREKVDLQQVKFAAERARIADFIEGRQGGYSAHIGERGIRLSGGQRQRIGIARALYRRARVLVFDEATSALDSATEQGVMEAIESLDRNLTVLIVAHRLSTVRHCDTIFEISHGQVKAQGSYDRLMETSPTFRDMVLAGSKEVN